MTSKLPILLFLGLPLLSQAQSYGMDRDRFGNPNNGYTLIPVDKSAIKGSPFLLPLWVPTTLQLVSEVAPGTIPAKYDIFRQELRVKLAKGDSILVPLSKLKEFTLMEANHNRRFVCLPAATLPADVGGACAEVLTDGSQVQLLKFWRKQVVKKQDETSSYATYVTQNVLEEQTSYYLRWPSDGHFAPLRLKRSSLEQALVGQPAALAALKARKGGLSSEADMAAALTAIGPLMTAQGH